MPSSLGVAAAVTLGGSLLYAVLAASLIPSFSEGAATLARGNRLFHELAAPSLSPSYVLIGIWERFDTVWYAEIARAGYQDPASVVFYPLYPLLIRALASVGVGYVASAVLVTRVGTLFFLWGLLELFRRDMDDRRALCAILLLLAWPGSFVLFGGYPESIAGAFAVWALVSAGKQRWRLASMLLACACLSKAVGVAVLPALAVVAWSDLRKSALPLLAGSLGAVAYPAWLYVSGRLLPNQAYTQYWRTITSPPWETLAAVASSLTKDANWLLVLNTTGLLLLGAAAVWKRSRPEFSVYVAACYLLFLTKQTRPLLQSSLRYLISAFPVFASAAASLPSPLAFGGVVLTLALLNLAGVYAFWNWGLVF
jgi:hypothetical protein